MPSMILRGFLVVGFCYDVGLEMGWDLGLGFDWEWGGIFIGAKWKLLMINDKNVDRECEKNK